MKRDILGSGIKNATNQKLVDLVVEHYRQQRAKVGNKGLLSEKELDIAKQEANKRQIAKYIDTILKGDNAVTLCKIDLSSAILLFKLITTMVENELKDFKRIAHLYNKQWLTPKNKDQQEYRDLIIKEQIPRPLILLKPEWREALDLQARKVKKLILEIQKIQEWTKYPLIDENTTKQIKENRTIIASSFGSLENQASDILYAVGEDQNTEYTIYQLTFHSLPEQDKKDLMDLYQEVAYEYQYLNEEEKIAELLAGKKTLTDTGKVELAKGILKKLYNRYAREYQLYQYYACIPLAELARHYLTKQGVIIKGNPLNTDQTVDNEDTKTLNRIQTEAEKYARKHNIGIDEMVRQGFLDWIDKGLFNEYTPLILGNKKDLLDRWTTARQKTRERIHTLIDKGELQTKDDRKTIIGESLYNLTGQPDLEKIISNELYNKDFRKYVKDNFDLKLFISTLYTIKEIADNHTDIKGDMKDLFNEATKEFIDSPDYEIATDETIYKLPYSNIELEKVGLTEADLKEVDELVEFIKSYS